MTLDFPSLIERINKSSQYESCLLGHVNVDLDPNAQLNVWLSSSATHQWNPNQAKPATPWEAEIDRLMRLQCRTLDENAPQGRCSTGCSRSFGMQAPLLYLVNRNALVAAARSLAQCGTFCVEAEYLMERRSLMDRFSEVAALPPLLAVEISADYPGKPGVLIG